MYADLEASLTQELTQLAEGVNIPPLPVLPSEPARVRRDWTSLLVAASLALIAGCAVLLIVTRAGEKATPAPAPPTPTQSAIESVAGIPTTQPTKSVYVVGDQLWAYGTRIDGRWWLVTSERGMWLALRQDNTWWTGYGPKLSNSLGQSDVPPQLADDGAYVGRLRNEPERVILTGENLFDEEDLGPFAIESDDSGSITLRAMLTNGRFIVQGTTTSKLWQPLFKPRVVDLAETAPGQVFGASTSAGLIVADGVDGRPYLAEISETGALRELQPLPEHDDLSISPGNVWMAWTPIGTTGGEVTAISTLQVRLLSYTDVETLHAPTDWAFKVRAFTWEGDDYIIAPVIRENGEGGERLARCRVLKPACVLINEP